MVKLNTFGIYLKNEKIENIDKIINYLEKNNYYLYFIKKTRYIKNNFSYMIIDDEYKYVKLHSSDDIKYYKIFYVSSDLNYILSDILTIDNYLKIKFKNLISKKRKFYEYTR